MLSQKKELISFFKEFTELLEKENLWYVAEAGTLLGAIREGGMIEWDDDIDVLISIETYRYLKNKYPKNFLDMDTKGYPFIIAKWVPDINNFLNSSIAIDLFPIIPTTQKRVNKYKKFKNVFRFANQMMNKGSKYVGFNWKLKLLKIVLWPIQWTTKKIDFEEVVEILEEKNNPEFTLMVDNPNSKINNQKSPLTIWNRKKIQFENYPIYIPVDYDEILKRRYGNDYMVPKKKINCFEHINAINVKK